MSNETPKFKRGCLAAVMQYLSEHPNQMVQIKQLEKAFAGTWERKQIMHALSPSTLAKGTHPLRQDVEVLGTGAWRLNRTGSEQPTPQEVQLPVRGGGTAGLYDMNITVIKETDDGGEMVVVDDLTNIYRMVRVG